jgi:nitrous oxidase accessory protein
MGSQGAIAKSGKAVACGGLHRRTQVCLALLFACLLPAFAATAALPLQTLVDEAEKGAVITPEPGVYQGPVTIDKPLTLDGKGKVTIDAGGKGSVIYLHTDGARIKGLHLTGSGESYNDIDTGIQVRGNFNIMEDNVIDDCLFGVDMQKSDNNIVRRNHISSKPFSLGERGDSVRLWYSFHNKVTDNVIRDARDMVVWYSANNLIARNDSRRGRYSLHFMYSKYNRVESNYYEDNSVGIFLMYSDSVEIRNNYISRASGPTGIGIGFKESSDVSIEGNKILYSAVGIYLDISPFQPDTTDRIYNNLIAYNGIAVRFLNDWHGNDFRGNRFKGNITQVVVDGGKTANRNLWEGNYWDVYEGFDQNGDGVGDTPYEMYNYADRIWMDVPYAQFFKGSPMLEVLDFMERLAPFSEPDMLVRDEKPFMTAQATETYVAPQQKEEESPSSGAAPSALDLLKHSLGRP